MYWQSFWLRTPRLVRQLAGPPPQTMAWRLKIPYPSVQGVAPDCVRVVALKYLDTGNVSFSITAAKQWGAC
jgi:hypothetical protein